MFDITNPSDWERYFDDGGIRALMAEHVWEHMTLADGQCAAALCFRFLEPGGHLRVAVPDGLHPDEHYIRMVEPNGLGPGADDHKVLYDYRNLSALLREAGFQIRLLEYFDEQGKFHFTHWDVADGRIRRSRRDAPDATQDPLNCASLVLDAVKPRGLGA